MMILFSDGDKDVCEDDDFFWIDEDVDEPCVKEWKLMKEFTQQGEAKAARDQGIKFIYVAVGPNVDKSNSATYSQKCMDNVINMAGGIKNVVEVGKMEDLDMGIMHEVVRTVCNPKL